MVVVTPETSRPEIAESIRYLNDQAKRLPHIVGIRAEFPTRHDLLHAQIDALLDEWCARGHTI